MLSCNSFQWVKTGEANTLDRGSKRSGDKPRKQGAREDGVNERHGGGGSRRRTAAALNRGAREGLTEKVKCPRDIVDNGGIQFKN